MNYKQLEVWQQAIELVVDVYGASSLVPSDERFGLRLQMRRAAISVASNIAEGEGRRAWRDHAHFIVQARGSLYELETQIVVCRRLAYLGKDAATELLLQSNKVGRLINGTLRYLTRKANSRQPTAKP